MSGVILHTDMNAFYASCERVFDPSIRFRPVIVLTNNDGCIAALTKDAKALGFKRGMPFFQIKNAAVKHNVAVRSSNYELYQAFSDRIARIIAGMVPLTERYSIDEVFADLTECPGDHTHLGHDLRDRIQSWTRIPCCVGIAPTKTLAKLCDHYAKTYPVFNGVVNWFDFTKERREKALAITPVKEIWGIGNRMAEKLERMGIQTAKDFCHMPAPYVGSGGATGSLRTKWFSVFPN